MAPEVSSASGLRRLADQLQTLSELTESLAYRLIELEEKVAAVDLRLGPLLEGATSESTLLAADTELRLDDTEARLARLEAVLAGLEEVPRSDGTVAAEPLASDASEPLETDSHFPEEDYEQTFLDEQADEPERLIA